MLRFLSRLFAVYVRRRPMLPRQQAEVHCLPCARREAARLPVRATRTERARARGRRPLPQCPSCAPPPAARPPRRRHSLPLGLALGACAALLLVVALQPHQLPHEPSDATAVTVDGAELPDAGTAGEVVTVDAFRDTGAPLWMGDDLRSEIPPESKAPDEWLRRDCAEGDVMINEMCFAELKQPPDRKGRCVRGLRHHNRCLAPVTKGSRPPSSIQRDGGTER